MLSSGSGALVGPSIITITVNFIFESTQAATARLKARGFWTMLVVQLCHLISQDLGRARPFSEPPFS